MQTKLLTDRGPREDSNAESNIKPTSQSWYVRPRVAAFSHDVLPRNSSCFTRKRQLRIRRALPRHNSSLVARGSRHERNTHGDSRSSFGSTLLRQTTHGSREGD